MSKDILLFSGGLDSYIAYFYLQNPTCLFIDLKHKYAEIEKRTVCRLQPYMENSIIVLVRCFEARAHKRLRRQHIQRR